VSQQKFSFPILSYDVGPRDDGDSFDVVVDLGFHTTREVRVRLLGIDAPELRVSRQTRAAIVARARLREWLDNWSKAGPLRLLSQELDQYGRPLGDIVADGFAEPSLCMYLLAIGVAVPWEGRRHAWTEEELLGIESLRQE
jgi:endonuclease YncB( thermonuclease family)